MHAMNVIDGYIMVKVLHCMVLSLIDQIRTLQLIVKLPRTFFIRAILIFVYTQDMLRDAYM